MESKNFNVYFFLFTLVCISILAVFIFKPFFIAIALAAILAVVFQKPFNFFLRITGNRQRISAFIISFLGIIIFGALFFGVISLVVKEVSVLYHNLYNQNYIDSLVQGVNSNPILKSLGADNLINKETIGKSISDLSQGAFSILQKTYESIANFILLGIVMFFTLYYFLIDGKELVRKAMYISPLRDTHEKMLIDKFISMSSATLKGSLITGIVQGIAGGLLFAAVGIPSAVIWGIVMMFFSLIPMFGTSLIWLPAGIIMLFWNIWQGVVILVVGVSVVSVIDNLLRPKLVGKDSQMNPLLVFFAMLGGINIFGFLGFIIGPIIVALALTLWDIYAVEFKSQLKKYNA